MSHAASDDVPGRTPGQRGRQTSPRLDKCDRLRFDKSNARICFCGSWHAPVVAGSQACVLAHEKAET